jgi:hypothetical protein
MIDSKGRDFVCLGVAKGEFAALKKKKREQAPALPNTVIYEGKYIIF